MPWILWNNRNLPATIAQVHFGRCHVFVLGPAGDYDLHPILFDWAKPTSNRNYVGYSITVPPPNPINGLV
jgi:hypothetical protein